MIWLATWLASSPTDTFDFGQDGQLGSYLIQVTTA